MKYPTRPTYRRDLGGQHAAIFRSLFAGTPTPKGPLIAALRQNGEDGFKTLGRFPSAWCASCGCKCAPLLLTNPYHAFPFPAISISIEAAYGAPNSRPDCGGIGYDWLALYCEARQDAVSQAAYCQYNAPSKFKQGLSGDVK